MCRVIGLWPVKLLHGDGELRRQERFFAKDGEFLDDVADVAIGIDEGVHLFMGLAAIAAAVIDELNDGDIAIKVTTNPRMPVVDDGVHVGGKQRFVLFSGGLILTGLQFVHDFHDDFGIFEQICADFPAQGGAFVIGHFGMRGRGEQEASGSESESGKGGGQQAHCGSGMLFGFTIGQAGRDGKQITQHAQGRERQVTGIQVAGINGLQRGRGRGYLHKDEKQSATGQGMRVIWAAIVLMGLSLGAHAQDLSGLARLDAGRSSVVTTTAGDVVVQLGLSQAVPWRVRVLDGPPRVVVDFREVDFTGIDLIKPGPGPVVALRAGTFRPGWSRLVLALDGPMTVARAGMLTGNAVAVELTLTPADQSVFAAQAAQPEPAEWALPTPAEVPVLPPRGEGPLVVVLDPGHGGIDPGAERDGYSEADLMLTFARELKEVLLREGGFAVVLTREEDVFVPLEHRSSVARAAGAHVFISLHADALEEGEAVGATIYTLSDEASDAAAQALAERHDRDDLLAGIDLSAQDDLVATVLMDMARTETEPRTERLALALETAITGAELRMHRHPRQEAGFSVLKAPDIPSVLVELGFLSSDRDLARLRDQDWRGRMSEAFLVALKAWAEEDAAIAALRRQ